MQNIHWDNYYKQDKDFGFITAAMLTKLLTYLKATKEPKTVLDIGCGTGQLTRELVHRGYQCVGIDMSSIAIKKASSFAEHTNHLQYIKFDIEQDDITTLPLQPYTLITCKLVYAFIKNKESLLEKTSRLLAKYGTFVLITPLTADAPEKPTITVDYKQVTSSLDNHFKIVQSFAGKGVTYFIGQNK